MEGVGSGGGIGSSWGDLRSIPSGVELSAMVRHQDKKRGEGMDPGFAIRMLDGQSECLGVRSMSDRREAALICASLLCVCTLCVCVSGWGRSRPLVL